MHNILCDAANLDLRTKKKLPGVITSAAILLYTRSQGLNQLQCTLGLIADKCGMNKEGLKILHDLGVVVSPTSNEKEKTTCETARKTDYGNSYNICKSKNKSSQGMIQDCLLLQGLKVIQK